MCSVILHFKNTLISMSKRIQVQFNGLLILLMALVNIIFCYGIYLDSDDHRLTVI